MFFSLQKKGRRTIYQENLEIIGSLSNLFSSSNVPFLHYRVAESLFCESFKAEDLSRSDLSADAKKGGLGIGLKTFLNGNGRTFQKVAEFNLNSLGKNPTEEKIANLRNARIDFTEKAHGLNNSLYHCVLRESNRFKIFEEPMNRIDISKIDNINRKNGVIHFDDGKDEYSFSISKSTLSKRFVTNKVEHEFDVQILKNPLDELRGLLNNKKFMVAPEPMKTIFLPLYSSKNKTVYEKSGLNQWNAGGRKRHHNEVYIPIPAVIHQLFPDFFPSRDELFSLKFPDGESLEASVCQDSGKALMTKPNRKLGKLILRDGLKLKEGELATYDKLQLLGIDSVKIQKTGELKYEINFSKSGSYESFIANSKNI